MYCCNLSVGLRLMCDSPQTGCARRITPILMWREQAIRVISMGELYCCLLPRCDALCTCRLGFLIATKWCCDQDVKVVPSADFTKRTCDRCGSLLKGGDVVATSPLPLHWMCNSPQTGCARRITPIYMWREQAIRVISSGDLYCCLLPQCDALCTCRWDFRSQQY